MYHAPPSLLLLSKLFPCTAMTIFFGQHLLFFYKLLAAAVVREIIL